MSNKAVMNWVGIKTLGCVLAVGVLCSLLTACSPPPSTSSDSVTTASSGNAAYAPLNCRPYVQAVADLGAQWQDFDRFIDECELSGTRGDNLLKVVTVSAARFYKELPSGTETVPLPRPLLLMGDKRVGSLPYSYPDDPPVSIELSFDEWREGFPHQINIFVRDPTVSGDHALPPMIWNAGSGRYSETSER